MQNQKPQKSKLKALAGGIISLGIFASFFAFDGGFFASEKLSADVAETATVEPEIVAIEPDSGAVGDTVSIVVANLANLTRGTGGIFFGDIPAEIETLDEAADGTITIFTRVPEVAELGNYEIKITTPAEMVAGTTEFEITELSELAPAPMYEAIETPPADPADEPIAEIHEPEIAELENVLADKTPATQNLEMPVETAITSTPIFAGVPPTNLTATPNSAGIALEWSAPDSAVDHFNIYYGTTSGKYIHRTTATGNFALLNSNFLNGTQYFFMVSAVANDGAESAGSNETAATYSPTAVAQIPQLAHASAQPEKLSEQGPAETLLIAIFVALGFSGFIFRRKILTRN